MDVHTVYIEDRLVSEIRKESYVVHLSYHKAFFWEFQSSQVSCILMWQAYSDGQNEFDVEYVAESPFKITCCPKGLSG